MRFAARIRGEIIKEEGANILNHWEPPGPAYFRAQRVRKESESVSRGSPVEPQTPQKVCPESEKSPKKDSKAASRSLWPGTPFPILLGLSLGPGALCARPGGFPNLISSEGGPGQ